MSQDRYRDSKGVRMDEYLDHAEIVYHDDYVSVRWVQDGERYGFDMGTVMYQQLRLTGQAPVVMELLVHDA